MRPCPIDLRYGRNASGFSCGDHCRKVTERGVFRNRAVAQGGRERDSNIVVHSRMCYESKVPVLTAGVVSRLAVRGAVATPRIYCCLARPGGPHATASIHCESFGLLDSGCGTSRICSRLQRSSVSVSRYVCQQAFFWSKKRVCEVRDQMRRRARQVPR
jgi:hypothetical protein